MKKFLVLVFVPVSMMLALKSTVAIARPCWSDGNSPPCLYCCDSTGACTTWGNCINAVRPLDFSELQANECLHDPNSGKDFCSIEKGQPGIKTN
jgi:hypothetical protein